MTKPTYLKL